MSSPLPRRLLLTTGTAAVVSAGLAPSALASGGSRRLAPFALEAQVLDGGEQTVSVTIDASRQGGLVSGELLASTFSVHVRGTDPLSGEVIVDTERTVTAAHIDHRSRITLDLEHGEEVEGASTLLYLDDSGRNVQLDLGCTITQHDPLPTRSGGAPTIGSFIQGDLVDPEVDAFTSHVSASGTNYRLFTPSGGAGTELPLVVWLHGGGEGGFADDNGEHYDNEAPLRANRGALGLATDEAQEIFGGAYVVAPQCPSAWMDDGPAFVPLVEEIIEEVAAAHPINRSRLHVTGCSNGGYMTLKMVVENPGIFASAAPICGVVEERDPGAGPLVSDEELAAISTPTWLITSANDDTVDPQANTVHAHGLIPGAILSLYDTVTWDGVEYPGHWSWIYGARNDPSHDGASLWEWMAAQSL